MKKKFLVLGMVFVMLFSVAGMMGCGNEYVFQEGDFRLTVTADRTEVRVGDAIEFTAKLENVSGRDITIQHFFSGQFNLDMIFVPPMCYEHTPEFGYAWTDCSDIRRPFGRRRRITIENNEIITYTYHPRSIEEMLFCFDSEYKMPYFKIIAGAMFYVNDEFIRIKSEPIKIYIIQGED